MSKITGKDLILLLLYVPGKTGEYGEKIEGRTRLQKMVFLFEKEVYPKFKQDKLITEEDLPRFIPYDYGPFSKQVYDDLEFLIGLGFVEAIPTSEQVEQGEEAEYWLWEESTGLEDGPALDGGIVVFEKQAYVLSKIGRDFVEKKLWPLLSENQKQALARLKLNCTKASLRTILRYVYEKYPETAKNSKIKDEILRDEVSISVYQY